MSNQNMTSQKEVNVTFAGDDDVLGHIISINEKEKTLKKKQSKVKKAVEEDDDEDIEDQDLYKPSEALIDERDVAGEDVFSFKKLKRKDQMSNLAQASAQAVLASPKAVSATVPAQPKTPQNARKRALLEQNNNTPQRLIRRNKKDYIESSTEESGESTTDDSDEEETKSKKETRTKKAKMQKKAEEEKSRKAAQDKKAEKIDAKAEPKKKGRPKKNIDGTVKTEHIQQYFSQQGDTGKTSDRTLSRLECPRLDQETLNEVLKEVEDPYVKEKGELYQEHKANFRKWMFQMCNGFNILLSGVGSKRHLLEDFRTTCLKDFTHLVINGYFPSITIKSVLTTITEDLLDHRGSFKSPVEQVEFIRKHFECGESHEDVYLIVHSIDGGMLRQEKVQTVLSLLAQIDGFHIIASIDHINAPLIWDQSKCSRFNWLWYDVTTYSPYAEETSYENSLLVQQSGVLALSSLTHVFKSLTPNARGIFLLVANYQLDNAGNNYTGLAFPDLYQKCREAFLVNSDLTLRTQLTEFRDHKLIRTKKIDGLEHLTIPLDAATLKEFIQQQDQS